ncbi:UNVERIFIED_ORG: hypothetical protein ABIC97_003439 [Peribacillus simplex]
MISKKLILGKELHVMKHLFTILLSLGLVFGLSLGSNEVAGAKTKVKTYKNCTALNKDYKGGVARSSSVKNKGGKTKYKPYVSKALYDANKKSDRDKDLIACER